MYTRCPKRFRPLMDTLYRTQQQASASHVSVGTAVALKSLIDACSTEIKALQIILEKTLPPPKSSSWRRRLLVLKSLARDKDVERSIAKLEGHIRLLALYHQSTNSSDSSNRLFALRQAHDITSHQPHKSSIVSHSRQDSHIRKPSAPVHLLISPDYHNLSFKPTVHKGISISV
jgi:hypothetical protein